MQRQTLLLFIGILLTIIAFSAAAGVASIFWKPAETTNPTVNKTKSGRKKDKDVEELRPVGEPDEDGNYWHRKNKNGTLTGILTSSRDGTPAEGVTVDVVSITTYTENRRTPKANESEEDKDEDEYIERGLSRSEMKKLVATSDSDGRYKLELPPSRGPVWLRFQSKRYQELQGQRVGFDKNATLDLVMVWQPITKIHVIDESGKAVKEFNVRASQSGFLGVADSMHHQSQKNPYEFYLSQGKWEIRVSIGSRSSKTQTVNSDAKNDISLEFTVPATNTK